MSGRGAHKATVSRTQAGQALLPRQGSLLAVCPIQAFNEHDFVALYALGCQKQHGAQDGWAWADGALQPRIPDREGSQLLPKRIRYDLL